jgi:hypothetical protein
VEIYTKGHEHGLRGENKKKNNPDMSLELDVIRTSMEKIAFKIQQNAKAHWVYEWPMQKKLKWLLHKFLARGQQQLLNRWLRYDGNLNDTEEEMVYIYEPKIGRHLNDEEEVRSIEDHIKYQMERNGHSSC